MFDKKFAREIRAERGICDFFCMQTRDFVGRGAVSQLFSSPRCINVYLIPMHGCHPTWDEMNADIAASEIEAEQRSQMQMHFTQRTHLWRKKTSSTFATEGLNS